MGETAAVRLLVFRIGSVACAALAEAVREILVARPPVRIPGAAPQVAGLVNVRGTLVTVFEGRRLLGQEQVGDPGAGRAGGTGGTGGTGGDPGTLVLLDVRGKTVGLTVDEVVDLLTLPSDHLEARQALPGVDPQVVRAVGRRGNQTFVLLDTDALIAPVLSS